MLVTSMDCNSVLIYLTASIIAGQQVSTETLLSPVSVLVPENSPVTLTCLHLAGTFACQWAHSGRLFFISGECKDVGVPKVNRTLYTFGCDENFTWTINNITRENEGDKWSCSITLNNGSIISSNTVEIHVAVPIQNVSMTSPAGSEVNIVENAIQTFVCTTSVGLPAPHVLWYKDRRTPSDNSDDDNITTFSTSLSKPSNSGLTIVTSTLVYKVLRKDNTFTIFCTANNSARVQTSDRKTLNVKYISKGPTIQEGNLYLVIENKRGELTCYDTGGNPRSTLNWFCYGGTESNGVTTGERVTNTVTWIASRRQIGSCICQSVQVGLTHSARNVSITVDVLYPPTRPKFYIKTTQVFGTVKVIKDNPAAITCRSFGMPNQIQYAWTSSSVSSSGSPLNISRVQNGGQYTCNVQNSMDSSDGNSILGRNSSSINIDVLYPPVVGDLVNRSITEGDSLTVSCPVAVGNPRETTFKWTNSSGGGEWRTQTLAIDKVSRNDAKFFYTCEVANEMQQTGKEQAISKPDRKSFHLNVWYGASITSFFIEGHRGQTHVTVDENDEGIQFICEVDSNPAATVKILLHDVILKERSNTKQISLIHSSVACLDGGEYTCEGNNQYGQLSRKSINLFVNCSPRPLHQMRQNITSALHVPVTLSFTALAYPQPGLKGFAWFKENDMDWAPILSNADLHISSSALQSNLTILNVSKADYGRYRLTVKNDLGSYVQYLFLHEEVVAEEGLLETCARYCKMETETTSESVIIGISLGVVVAVLAIYATSISILYKRKTTSKDQELVVRESTQRTYVNVAYKPKVPASQNNDGTIEAEGDEARQYTDLAGYSRDDRTTYEVLQDL